MSEFKIKRMMHSENGQALGSFLLLHLLPLSGEPPLLLAQGAMALVVTAQQLRCALQDPRLVAAQHCAQCVRRLHRFILLVTY